MTPIRPEDIDSTGKAIEFILQEMREINRRLNVLENNDQTLNERTKFLRGQFETNANRYDRKLADIRGTLSRLQGIHGS